MKKMENCMLAISQIYVGMYIFGNSEARWQERLALLEPAKPHLEKVLNILDKTMDRLHTAGEIRVKSYFLELHAFLNIGNYFQAIFFSGFNDAASRSTVRGLHSCQKKPDRFSQTSYFKINKKCWGYPSTPG